MNLKSFGLVLLAILAACPFTTSAQGMRPDECVWRLISYDIQSNPVLTDVTVSFSSGTAKLNLFGSSNSRWLASTRSAIQRGEPLASIARRDRSVSHLIALEKRVRQISLVNSVSWSADKPCTPGFICQSTGGFITAESVAPCSAYKDRGPAPVKLGGLGIYTKSLESLLPAKVGRFKLLQKASGPGPRMREPNPTDSAGGIYVSTDKKALQFTIINFADLDGPTKAMKVLVTDDGRRPRNSFSEGPAKMKNGRVVGKRYNVNFEGIDVAFSFWSNGSVLVFLQGMKNTKRELNLQPANKADLTAFENALTY